MENLYSYGFWYNTYESIWYAIPLGEWTLFFSGAVDRDSLVNVLKSSEINNLIEVINNPEFVEWSELDEEDEEDIFEDPEEGDNWLAGDHWGE
jgi:hypothetical protein